MILSPWYFSTGCNEAGRAVYPQYTMQQRGRGEILFIHFLLTQFWVQQEVLCFIYNLAHCGWWLEANDQSELLTQPGPRATGLLWFPWITAAPRGTAGKGSLSAGQYANICINYIFEAEFSSALHARAHCYSVNTANEEAVCYLVGTQAEVLDQRTNIFIFSDSLIILLKRFNTSMCLWWWHIYLAVYMALFTLMTCYFFLLLN